MRKNQAKQLENYYLKVCEENEIEPDIFDFKKEIDFAILTYDEAKNILKERLSPLIKDENKTTAKFEKIETERIEQNNNRLEEESTRQISEEYNSKLTTQEEIKTYYSRLRRTVELIAKGYLNSAFIHGRGGLGKTFNIISTLNELGLKQDKDYITFQGDISEAYLYRFLYENKDKIIIMRDLAKLLMIPRSIDILKAVTETTGKRIVMRANYSKEQEDLPNIFEFSGKLIFEFNNLHFNGMKEDIEALFSRGEYYNMVLSLGDIRDIMNKICKDEKERETTDYLIENYRYTGINTLNLRTQQKAFKIREYAEKEVRDWKLELKIFLESEMTTTRRNLYQLIGDKAFNTKDLKKLLIKSGTDSINHLGTASRRIRDYVVLNELFIVGFVTEDEEELEKYMNDHRNYFVSINPIEKIGLGE
jgi:hypothetical protein